MTVEERTTPSGIHLVTISSPSGMSVELSNFGAGIVSLVVPDRHGHLADVVLGYRNPDDYMADGPCMGKTPGRFANRIAGGHLKIEGKEYALPINNGPNHLHGGPDGFQNKLWQTTLLPNGVRFTLESEAGEMGYPGKVKAEVEYTLDPTTSTLNIDYRATTDAPTVINLTNHTYWNLKGEEKGGALEHRLTLKASRYLPTDETLIPTGELAPVAETPMDFKEAKTIGRDIKQDFPALKYAKGYDASWVIDGWAPGKFQEKVAILEDPESGRRLEVGTDQPAAHLYSGNWLAGSPKSKNGREYADYDGIALEFQGYPDAPSQPAFPSQLLTPENPYHRRISFTLTTVE